MALFLWLCLEEELKWRAVMLSKVCCFHPADTCQVFCVRASHGSCSSSTMAKIYVWLCYNRNLAPCFGRQHPKSPRIQCRIQQETVIKTWSSSNFKTRGSSSWATTCK